MRKRGRRPNWERARKWHLMTLKGWTYQAIADLQTELGHKITRQGVADAVLRYRRAHDTHCPVCCRPFEEPANNE